MYLFLQKSSIIDFWQSSKYTSTNSVITIYILKTDRYSNENGQTLKAFSHEINCNEKYGSHLDPILYMWSLVEDSC